MFSHLFNTSPGMSALRHTLAYLVQHLQFQTRALGPREIVSVSSLPVPRDY
jgi:hypothetical protein